MTLPDEAWQFGRDVAATLEAVLEADLLGVYFVGSLALGGYVAGESDIDIVAVCRSPVPEVEKTALARDLVETAAHCPARGMEFTMYRAGVASSPPQRADFELNVNGGPRMQQTVRLSPAGEPGFWYVLDRAIAHRKGRVIAGPPAAEIFADSSRSALLDAMAESVRWHREHEGATLYSVLNASRAWRFAVENVLGSKLEGAVWARERWPEPSLIDAAVDLRHGRPAQLNAGEVDVFLQHVEAMLERTASE